MSYYRYDLPRTDAQTDARLLYLSVSKHSVGWHSMPHTHSHMELFYCTGGSGRFRVMDQLMPVAEDDIVLVDANVSHTEYSSADDPLSYIVLGIDGVACTDRDGQPIPFAIFNCGRIRRSIRYHLEDMAAEMQSRKQGYEAICQSLLQALMLKALRLTEGSASAVSDRRSNSECSKVKHFIDNHYSQNLSLDLLAAQAHINKYYLAHLFQQEYGVSPIKYLIDCRIRESRHFLEDTDYSMSQISVALGFSSLSYFSQTFHRTMGMSPNAYRKAKRMEKERETATNAEHQERA